VITSAPLNERQYLGYKGRTLDFPNDPTFKDRLAMMADTFRYRLGAMVLIAGLFIARESPHLRLFGAVMCAWIAFEVLIKLYIQRSRK
jgi:hypothetical protein